MTLTLETKNPLVPKDAKVEQILMSEIFHDTVFNCRGEIAPIDVVDLAQNIRETGLIQPIILQPYGNGPKGTKYRIVAGYRRHMAHIVNNAEYISAIILHGLSDKDAKLINLSENLNRKDLTLLQEASAVLELVRQGLKQQEMAEKLQVSRGWVQIRLYTLKLPKAIQEDIKAGWITSEHIIPLNGMTEDEQYEIVKKIKETKQNEGMRVRVKVNKQSVKKDPTKSGKRDHRQIEKMMEHILDNLGASFATRALSWAAGNISTTDLYGDIAEEAENLGTVYYPPEYDVSC